MFSSITSIHSSSSFEEKKIPVPVVYDLFIPQCNLCHVLCCMYIYIYLDARGRRIYVFLALPSKNKCTPDE